MKPNGQLEPIGRGGIEKVLHYLDDHLPAMLQNHGRL